MSTDVQPETALGLDLSLEPQTRSFTGLGSRVETLATVGAATLALAIGAGAEDSIASDKGDKSVGYDTPQLIERTPTLKEFCVIDEGGITLNDNGRREELLNQSKQLGATCLRINIFQRPRKGSDKWTNYDQTIASAKARGMKVQLTITDYDHKYEPKKFANHVKQTVVRYRKDVDRYSVYNEPNMRLWLQPAKSKTVAQTYRTMYKSAYKTIKKNDPGAEVLIGELAPHKAFKFLKDVMCYSERARPKCKPLKADGLAIHPYQYFSPPNKPHTDSTALGIGSLSRVNRLLYKSLDKKLLTTPRGSLVPIYITEFGYFCDGRGQFRKRNLVQNNPKACEKKRANWTVNAAKVASTTPNVKLLTYYHLSSSGLRQPWDTGIITPDGTPTLTFKRLRSWIDDQKELTR